MTLRGLAILIGLLVSASLFGCEDRYGTYITIRAANNDLAFDSLDLYFGVDPQKGLPTTPKHKEIDDLWHLVVRRSIADTDHVAFGERVLEYTVWVPDGGENDELGPYLLAIASVNGQPIAVGELFDFDVTTDREVLKYKLALNAYDAKDLESWGRADADCLRYELDRGPDHPTVVAIVRHDDADCDAFTDRGDGANDCEPLIYCDGSGSGDCVGTQPCLRAADTCSIGVCSNKDGASLTCEENTCVADLLCMACDLTRPPPEILDCALTDPRTHPASDLDVPCHGDGTLCRDPMEMDIALPFPCTDPLVEAIGYSQMGGPFLIEAIVPGPAPNVCRIRIQSTEPDEIFSGVPHVLITIDVGGRRTGFVLGLIGRTGGCPPGGTLIERTYAPAIGDCPVDP